MAMVTLVRLMLMVVPLVLLGPRGPASCAGSGDGVGVQGGVKTLQGLFVTILFPVAPDILKPSLIQ